jgi:hypothetical protein
MTAVWLGLSLRTRLPVHHLTAETKETVNIAMGLIATMSALLLGLLVSAMQDSYKTVQDQVITLGAKVSFIDRVLSMYGAEAASLQTRTRTVVQDTATQMWRDETASGIVNREAAEALYVDLLRLEPRNEMQEHLKSQAVATFLEVGQLRTLMRVQSAKTMTWPLLVAVVFWVVVIFFSFSLFAPRNATATLALVISALSVAMAVFLILELNEPFHGLIRIAPELLRHAVPAPA